MTPSGPGEDGSFSPAEKWIIDPGRLEHQLYTTYSQNKFQYLTTTVGIGGKSLPLPAAKLKVNTNKCVMRMSLFCEIVVCFWEYAAGLRAETVHGESDRHICTLCLHSVWLSASEALLLHADISF